MYVCVSSTQQRIQLIIKIYVIYTIKTNLLSFTFFYNNNFQWNSKKHISQ